MRKDDRQKQDQYRRAVLPQIRHRMLPHIPYICWLSGLPGALNFREALRRAAIWPSCIPQILLPDEDLFSSPDNDHKFEKNITRKRRFSALAGNASYL